MTATATQNRAAWLEARQAGIGGSDCAAAVGLSPFKSPLTLYMEKRGEIEPDQAETEAAYWGTKLEAAVAERYTEVTGKRVRRQPMRSCLNNNFMLANIDRQILEDPRGPGVLEVKTSNAFKRVDGLDDLPDHYYLQMQHYLAVTNYRWGAFAFLIGGQKFVHFEVERDQATIDVLIEQETLFWRRVRCGNPPTVDGSDATRALLSHMYPQDSGETITLDNAEAARQLVSTKQRIAEIEAQKQALENLFKAEIGAASVAIIPGFGKITWRTAKPSQKEEIDFSLLSAHYPAIYIDLLRTGIIKTKTIPGSRRFLVTPDKEPSK